MVAREIWQHTLNCKTIKIFSKYYFFLILRLKVITKPRKSPQWISHFQGRKELDEMIIQLTRWKLVQGKEISMSQGLSTSEDKIQAIWKEKGGWFVFSQTTRAKQIFLNWLTKTKEEAGVPVTALNINLKTVVSRWPSGLVTLNFQWFWKGLGRIFNLPWRQQQRGKKKGSHSFLHPERPRDGRKK